MKIDTNDVVTVTEASNKGVSWLVNEAATGRTVVLTRNSHFAAVIAGVEVMEQLQDLDEREENLRLWSAALTRAATDSGERYDLDEVAREFGVDLDDED